MVKPVQVFWLKQPPNTCPPINKTLANQWVNLTGQNDAPRQVTPHDKLDRSALQLIVAECFAMGPERFALRAPLIRPHRADCDSRGSSGDVMFQKQ